MGSRSKQRRFETVWVEGYCTECAWRWVGTDPAKGLELAEAHSVDLRHTVYAGEPGGIHAFIPGEKPERVAEVQELLAEVAQERP